MAIDITHTVVQPVVINIDLIVTMVVTAVIIEPAIAALTIMAATAVAIHAIAAVMVMVMATTVAITTNRKLSS